MKWFALLRVAMIDLRSVAERVFARGRRPDRHARLLARIRRIESTGGDKHELWVAYRDMIHSLGESGDHRKAAEAVKILSRHPWYERRLLAETCLTEAARAAAAGEMAIAGELLDTAEQLAHAPVTESTRASIRALRRQVEESAGAPPDKTRAGH